MVYCACSRKSLWADIHCLLPPELFQGPSGEVLLSVNTTGEKRASVLSTNHHGSSAYIAYLSVTQEEVLQAGLKPAVIGVCHPFLEANICDC